jgi:PTH1 family peptidyl-tRNA hydrolase
MPDEIEFLVVGLGNPGAEYENTPHNMGFRVIDRLAETHSIRVGRKENVALVGTGVVGTGVVGTGVVGTGVVGRGAVAGKAVALAKPQTFMNLSGASVRALLERYGLGPDRLIVVYDELDLPFGSLRVRLKGSAAGHNGMKSVIGSLGTNEFVRVRVGVWPPRPEKGGQTGNRDGATFVLAPFRRAQMKEVEEIAGRAAEAVETIIAEGAEKAMAKFNRRALGLQTEEE